MHVVFLLKHTIIIYFLTRCLQVDTIDGRNLIFGHKLHIGTPYCGKRFLTRQIPISCLPKSGGIISAYMKLVTKYQISGINSC
jgi:hypothetical protein